MSSVGQPPPRLPSQPNVPPPPTRPAPSLPPGYLRIGGKYYKVQYQGNKITNPETLVKVMSMLPTPLGDSVLNASHITLGPPSQVPEVAGRVFVGVTNKETFDQVRTEARTAQAEVFKEALTRQFKGYSKEQVLTAIDSIFQEAHIAFLTRADPLQSNRSQERSEWGEKTIADLLQEPGNESLRLALVELREEYRSDSTPSPDSSQALRKSETTARCRKDLQIFVLQNMQRNPKVVGQVEQHVMKGNGRVSGYLNTTTLCTLDDIARRNKGFPSEMDKSPYDKSIKATNTNLGAVVSHDASGGRVICTRSGKSDTVERLQELVATSCLEALECGTQNGFTTNEQGKLEFQLVVTSFLDQSSVKALPEVLKGLVSHSENEQASFQKILEAQKQWPERGIEITVLHEGQPTQVILKKPIIRNQLLSSTVRGTNFSSFRLFRMGQKRADNTNLAANHELLKIYLQKNPEVVLSERLRMDTEHKIDFSKISSRDLKIYQFEVMRMLNQQAQAGDLTAKALFVTMFRQYPTISCWPPMPPPIKKEIHAADLVIYQNIVLRELNLTGAMQCKSGTDRTGLGVALAVAQDQFRQKYKKDFDPEKYRDVKPGDPMHGELLAFKSMFREALKELAVSMTVETKGYSGIKWGGGVPFIGGVGNPVAYKYLFIEGDKTPDVEGLTYEDTRRGGLAHYKGSIIDRLGLFGKSQSSTAKALRTRQKELSKEDREKARTSATAFLRDNFGISHTSIFNDNLQLQVPISELNLTDQQIDHIKTRIDILKKRESSIDHLELYALEQLVLIHEAYKKAEGGQNIVLDLVSPPQARIPKKQSS